MLEHHEQQEENPAQQQQQPSYTPPTAAPGSAAERERVTAEEFTAAISALEQRKAAEASHLAGTVEIGQTVRELSIDASAEDIYREVLAQRARNAPPVQQQAPPPHLSPRGISMEERERAAAEAKARLATAASEAVRGLSAAAVVAQSHLQEMAADYHQKAAQKNLASAELRAAEQQTRLQQRLSRRTRGGIGSLIGIGVAFWVMWSLMTGHLLTSFPFSFTHSHHYGPGGPFISASALPDGHTAWASTDTALKLLGNGGSIAKAGDASVSQKRMDNGWEIINHGGNLYLHGYVAQLDHSPADGSLAALKLFNDDNAGDLNGAEDEAVTVPLKGSVLEDQMQTSGWSDIRLSNVKVDEHFKDMTDADGPLDH